MCFCSPLKPILWIIFPFNIVDFDACRLFSTLLRIAQSNQSGTKWLFPKTARIKTWRSSLPCEWISLKTWSTLGKCLSWSELNLFWMCIRKFLFFEILEEKHFFSSSLEVKWKINIKMALVQSFIMHFLYSQHSLLNAYQPNSLNFKQYSSANCKVIFFL